MICKVCGKNVSNLKKHVSVSFGKEVIKKHMPYYGYLALYENFKQFSKENLRKLYIDDMQSTPMISENLKINKPTLLTLMHYYKIALRNTSEAAKNQIKRDGMWNDGLTKYSHPSIMRYANARKGKNNPFYTAPGFEERYKKSKERYFGIHRQQCHKRMPESTEGRMVKILDSVNLSYVRNFCLKKNCGSWRTFDFLINSNFVIEMQGNYYHANPTMYQPDDYIVISKHKRLVKDIWEYDEDKKKLALDMGYKYLSIWEEDFKQMTDNEVLKLLEIF